MNIRFCGAADGVTGSCHLVTAGRYKFLLDCGLFQGSRTYEAKNRLPFPFDPAEIDFVILSHAHVDHCGRLPMLVKQGFKGYIYCTDATADLAELILRDTAYIESREMEYRNRKNLRGGGRAEKPIYSVNDAISVLRYLYPVLYDTRTKVGEGISIRFTEAGHILGSSSVEIWIDETDEKGQTVTEKLVFSGDLGNSEKPFLKNQATIGEADYVIMESTFGKKETGHREDLIAALADAVKRTILRGGTAVIPAYAVGRTQELLYYFNYLMKNDPEFAEVMKGRRVYVDSPMAEAATDVYKRNALVYDSEAHDLLLKGEDPLDFPGLVYTRDLFDSQMLNKNKNPKVIIAAGGMCDSGRIKHHLKHVLWKEENSIIITGFQAKGTLGRYLIDGTEDVKIYGELVRVRAEICDLAGISGHASKEDLLNWAKAMSPKAVFLVHGEKGAKIELANAMKAEGIRTVPIMEECAAETGSDLILSDSLQSSEDARMEVLMKMKYRLSDVHRTLEHLLYVTHFDADIPVSDEEFRDIYNMIIRLEEDTQKLVEKTVRYDINKPNRGN